MIPHVPDDVWYGNAGQIAKLARQKAGRPVRMYTDTMGDNATRLPLVSMLFPGAPIIYVRRHPLDCCLANYFKSFANLDYAFRQDWLGEKYRDLSETMAVSRRTISNPMLDVSYEELVTDPGTVTRRVVEFVGLPWDDRFANPEEPRRVSETTSGSWLVHQPIKNSYAARWKPYEPYLAELIEALGGMEWVEQEVAATALAASQ